MVIEVSDRLEDWRVGVTMVPFESMDEEIGRHVQEVVECVAE